MKHDCKTFFGLIQDGFFTNWKFGFDLWLMTSNFLYLSFFTLYSSFLWRTNTLVFAKLKKPPICIKPHTPYSSGGLNRGFTVHSFVAPHHIIYL